MFEELVKYSLLTIPFMSGIAWINRGEGEKNPFKKTPNPPEPWDPNFIEQEEIDPPDFLEEIAQIKEHLEIALRGLEKIEIRECFELDKED